MRADGLSVPTCLLKGRLLRMRQHLSLLRSTAQGAAASLSVLLKAADVLIGNSPPPERRFTDGELAAMERLRKLRDDGVLSQDEIDRQRAAALRRT